MPASRDRGLAGLAFPLLLQILVGGTRSFSKAILSCLAELGPERNRRLGEFPKPHPHPQPFSPPHCQPQALSSWASHFASLPSGFFSVQWNNKALSRKQESSVPPSPFSVRLWVAQGVLSLGWGPATGDSGDWAESCN